MCLEKSGSSCPTCRKLLSFMFTSVDAASSKSNSIMPPKKPLAKEHAEDSDTIEESPNMNDIRSAIKVIGVIRKLIDQNELVLKPPTNQHGLVKKGLIPIEPSRKFTSRVGTHKKSLQQESEPNNEEADDANDEEDEDERISKFNSKPFKAKKEALRPKKLNAKVNQSNLL